MENRADEYFSFINLDWDSPLYPIIAILVLISLVWWVITQVAKGERERIAKLPPSERFSVAQFHVLGCGVIYYGKRDFRFERDTGRNSFITTAWVILFKIPLIPLNSVRMEVESHPQGYPFVKERLKIYDKTKPNSKQVIGTYMIIVLEALLICTAWIILANDIEAFGRPISKEVTFYAWLFIFALPALIVWALRYLAESKVDHAVHNRR
jgi:hypothetical protein